MATAKVEAIESADAFNDFMEKSEQYLLVIDCHQSWCGPCDTVKPTYNSIFNELKDFLPQGGVRRRPKKVPLSFSALARGALQAPGCAEDRHSPPAGLPEGRRRQWCARRNDDGRLGIREVLRPKPKHLM